jgi:uncharacterized protein
MTVAFADTFYWIALLSPGDRWYQTVMEYSRKNSNIYLVLTDGILDEILNYFAERGSFLRSRAIVLYESITSDPNVRVIPYSSELRIAGLELYKKRLDKGYSLTDCISMVVMRQMGINEVLTHDKHFKQEGFTVLFQDLAR